MAVKILGCILLALLLTYVSFSVVGLVLKIVSRKKMKRKQMTDESISDILYRKDLLMKDLMDGTDIDENAGGIDNTSTDVTSTDEGK